MHVRRPREGRERGVAPAWAGRPALRLRTPLAIAALAVAAGFALAGCGQGKAATAVVDCGTSHTAADVPVQIHVEKGQVSCRVALAVEASYAKAIQAGKAPGNGGGGPVMVNGWTCQGFNTPQVLKTGEASKCLKGNVEILATLKTPTS